MRIENDIKLDYKDVLIKPKRSKLESRADVSLFREFPLPYTMDPLTCVPVVASNMTTVGTRQMLNATFEEGMLTCLHKFVTLDELNVIDPEVRKYAVVSLGASSDELSRFLDIAHIGYKMACIDVANGYTEKFVDSVKAFKSAFPSILLWAGNVVTAEMTEELILAGVKVVKVGIGSGSACTTRLLTGVGYPQLSAVIECADAAHGLGGYVCADGGITQVGDIAKALGAGADFVMLGGMLSGYYEGVVDSSQIIDTDDGPMAEFYGMSSKKANDKFNGGLKDYRSSEGRELLVPYKGLVAPTLQNIAGGLRSACTYVGAKNIKELPKRTTFVRVTQQVNESLL